MELSTSDRHARCRYLPVLAAAVAALALALAPTSAPAQEVARVTGTVVDQDGDPVSGATVVFSNDDLGFEADVTTDEEGRFARGGLRPATTYTISVEAEGYLPVENEIEPSMGNNEIEITVRGGLALARQSYNRAHQAFQAQSWQQAADRSREVIEVVEDEMGEVEGDGGGGYAGYGGDDEGESEDAQMYKDALTINAYSNLRLQNHDVAETTYEKLTEVAPDDARGFFGLGQVNAMQRDFEKAAESLGRAAELTPDDVNTQYALGRVQIEAGDFDGAIEALNKVLELNPELAEAHRFLGTAYVQKKEFETALEHFETYLEEAQEISDRQQVEEYVAKLRKAVEQQEEQEQEGEEGGQQAGRS